MAISVVNGVPPIYALYSMTPGPVIVVPGAYVFSVAKITGTQQIRLLGASRLRVI